MLARNEQGLWSEVGISDGIIVFEEVDITKDTIAPKIKIIAPDSGDTFGITAPSFTVEISDANLDSMWYSLNSDENITFTSNGTINQIAWNALSEGTVSITFYANDTAGNVNSKEVLVKKEISQPPSPGGGILGYTLFFLIGTICVISIVLIKKEKFLSLKKG